MLPAFNQDIRDIQKLEHMFVHTYIGLNQQRKLKRRGISGCRLNARNEDCSFVELRQIKQIIHKTQYTPIYLYVDAKTRLID